MNLQLLRRIDVFVCAQNNQYCRVGNLLAIYVGIYIQAQVSQSRIAQQATQRCVLNLFLQLDCAWS